MAYGKIPARIFDSLSFNNVPAKIITHWQLETFSCSDWMMRAWIETTAHFPKNFIATDPMRNVISPQLNIGQTEIANINIDVTSRDDIPLILPNLQHIYTMEPLRQAVFNILNEVIPYKTVDGSNTLVAVDADKWDGSMGYFGIGDITFGTQCRRWSYPGISQPASNVANDAGAWAIWCLQSVSLTNLKRQPALVVMVD